MLKNNEVIIFPTDTVYGIGCNAFDKEAQKRIYEIKKRPENKRLSILCKDLAQIETIAILTEDAKKLIEAYMPGGLTLILNAKPEVVGEGIFTTVGVRVPKHPLALKLLEENGPMATTSVNLSGTEPLNDYDKIMKEFGSLVDMIYPNDEKTSNISSTVIDLTVNPYTLIREGELSFQTILNFLHK